MHVIDAVSQPKATRLSPEGILAVNPSLLSSMKSYGQGQQEATKKPTIKAVKNRIIKVLIGQLAHAVVAFVACKLRLCFVCIERSKRSRGTPIPQNCGVSDDLPPRDSV